MGWGLHMKRDINGIFVPQTKAFLATISTGIPNSHVSQSRTPWLLQDRSLAFPQQLPWACGCKRRHGSSTVALNPAMQRRAGCHAYQACRAQMGSISVTYTMEPMAFRAAQHPFPTWAGKEHIQRRESGKAHFLKLLEGLEGHPLSSPQSKFAE